MKYLPKTLIPLNQRNTIQSDIVCQGTTLSRVSKIENIPYTTLERIYYDIAKEKDIIKQQNLRREALFEQVPMLFDAYKLKRILPRNLQCN